MSTKEEIERDRALARERVVARIAFDFVRRKILGYRGKPEGLKKHLLSELDSLLSDLDEKLEYLIVDLTSGP